MSMLSGYQEPTANSNEIHFVVVYDTDSMTWYIDDAMTGETFEDGQVYNKLAGEFIRDDRYDELVKDVTLELSVLIGEPQ